MHQTPKKVSKRIVFSESNLLFSVQKKLKRCCRQWKFGIELAVCISLISRESQRHRESRNVLTLMETFVLLRWMSPFLCLQGELKLTTIQKNVKQSIKDEFSLFCLGIGFDVDYDFLQRIATDNRGMAQRIFGNQETSLQMKVSFCLIPSETLLFCSQL